MQAKPDGNQGNSAVVINCKGSAVRIEGVLPLLLIFAGSFAVLIGSGLNPNSMSTDSGVFAYCGQQILQGKQLYQDCWDNKPPGIYYLNALAVLLGGNTPGSIWLFQSLWMALSGFIFFMAMRQVWKPWLAWVLTTFFMLTVFFPGYYQGGNFTEAYVLLPLTLQIWAMWRYLRSARAVYLVGMGVFTACAFLLKPTYISVGAASILVVLYLDSRRGGVRQLLRKLVLLLGCAALPLIVTAAYFAATGGFDDLVFAVFTHNLRYVQSGFSKQAFLDTISIYLWKQPLASISAMAGLSIMVFLLDSAARSNSVPRVAWGSISKILTRAARGNPQKYLPERMEIIDARYWLILGLILSIPADFAFITASGKNFGHYFITPILALTASMAYLFFKLEEALRSKSGDMLWARTVALMVGMIMLLWLREIALQEIPRQNTFKTNISQLDFWNYKYTELEQYIVDHSQQGQTVLIWSSDPSLNFITGLRSPTRYIFPRHLLTPTMKGQHGFYELIQELKQEPPAVIAAQPTCSAQVPFFGLPEDQLCLDCSDVLWQGLSALKRYVENNYTEDKQIWDWVLYLPK